MCRRRFMPAALFLLALADHAHADTHVSVRALPTVPGQRCAAIDINDAGDVLVDCAPLSFPGPTAQPYVWSNGVRIAINGPADTNGCIGINNAKQVACNTTSSGAFLWQNGTVTPLAPAMQSVVALNDIGEVVGRTNVPTGTGGTFNGLRRADGTIVTIPASLFVFQNALNNLSQVGVRPLTRPLFDTIGTWSPASGFVVADKGWDLVRGLNDAGQMPSVLNFRAMLFTPGRGWQELPVPPGYPSATASANSVNTAGQVAGSFAADGLGQPVSSAETHGAYWITRAYPIDLGAFQSMPTNALASNPSGLVVGFAVGPSADLNVPLIWTVTTTSSSLPQSSPTDVAFRWVPTDGSGASGRITLDASATNGPFSVSADRVTSLQFTFAPGVSIQLVEGVEQTGRPVMSFDGTGLDSGTIRLRRGAYLADVLMELRPDIVGADQASFDPLGEVDQRIIRLGRWVRENATPPPATQLLPGGVVGAIDATQAFSDDPFGINTGLAYDSMRDVLYVARGGNNPIIYTLTTSGSVARRLNFQTVFQPNYIPRSLTYDAASDHLYVFANDSTAQAARVVEMTTDGTQIVRVTPLPISDDLTGMVRSDGIWLLNTSKRTMDRYSFTGTLLEQVSIALTFPNSTPTSVLPSFAGYPTGTFMFVDEQQNRLAMVGRLGDMFGTLTISTLDADHLGVGRVAAMDPAGLRMFLLSRDGTIFIMSADFWQYGNVTPFLQLSDVSSSFSPSPSPAGPSGRFTITARFQNGGGSSLCGLRFTVTELTVDGHRGVDQLESASIGSTGQQTQGFSQQILGHPRVDLGPHAEEDFIFTIDLGSPRPFVFLVDAWAKLLIPGAVCGE